MAGRPTYEPTPQDRKTVSAMIAYGIPQVDVAAVLGIAEKTLRRAFKEEIRTAVARANAAVAQNLYRMATSTKNEKVAVTASIFWLKTRAGWKETTRQELVTPRGVKVYVPTNDRDG